MSASHISGFFQSAANFVRDSAPVQFGLSGAWQAQGRRWIPDPDTKGRSRTLVICFDGTGDRFDQHNSNVIQFVSLLKKDELSKQMVYYQTGIGTASEADARFSFIRKGSQLLDLMFATTLGLHVREGYEFVCQNYQRGDVVCIFGFSRGAYTARALAGMIQKVGVLPPWNTQMIPFAYQMYSSQDNVELAKDFKATFSVDVKIEFVGVWDTVASVGLLPRYLPFVSSNSSIRYFRHAVALDEHRVKFAPSYYRRSRDQDQAHLNDWELQQIDGSHGAHVPNGTDDDDEHTDHPIHPDKPEKKIHKSQKTDSLEVWFAGAHTDIGGGSVPNHTRHSLARIPLRWMIRECFNCKTGIIFDGDLLRDMVGMDVDLEHMYWVKPAPHHRLRPDPNNPAHRIPAPPWCLKDVPFVSNVPVNGIITLPLTIFQGVTSKILSSLIPSTSAPQESLPPSPLIDTYRAEREPFKGEDMEELLDALSPSFDQLEIAPFWWLLEFVPLQLKKELAVYSPHEPWISNYAWVQNRGEGRKIFKHVVGRGIKVHRSVLTRLEALDANGNEGTYQPWVHPNFVKRANSEGEEDIHCRRMTNDEWRNQITEKLGHKWHDWVH